MTSGYSGSLGALELYPLNPPEAFLFGWLSRQVCRAVCSPWKGWITPGHYVVLVQMTRFDGVAIACKHGVRNDFFEGWQAGCETTLKDGL